MKKIIIIGAGPAGLTAGYELSKNKEYEVYIFEEDKQVGGISKTINYNGNRMDLGGHRFFSKDERIIKWWNEFLPMQGNLSYDDKVLNRDKKLVEGGPDPEVDNDVMLKRNRISRIYYLKKFFDYPVSLKFETFKNMGIIRTIKSGFSYLKSIFYKRKENSLEDFYINRFGKVLYSMFFEKYTEKLWGRHPSQIAADWGKQRVKGLSIMAVVKDMFNKTFHIKSKNIETSLIEEYMYPKYGPGQLWEKVAEKITENGGKIYLKTKVTNINTDSNTKIESIDYIENGEIKTIQADYIISSMPIKDLINGIKDNNISKEIVSYANGLPYRDFMTVGLLVKKLNLENKTNIATIENIIPDCWIYIQEPNVKLGRIQIFNNWSPYLVQNVDENVWMGLEYFCNENDEYWNMSDEEFSNFAIDELVKMKIINREDVLDYNRVKVKKAYPAYFDTYDKIDEIVNYINKFKNLYCIGRNGQHRYNNMDHSMMTAFETVKNIESNITDKTNIWNVNTEKEYHEEKR